MIRTLRFTVTEEQSGRDIRTFVRRTLGLSASVLKALKYEGEIQKNGVHARSTERLAAGDVLSLSLFEHCRNDAANGRMPPVLFEDEDFLVLDKPSAMPVYPTPGHDNDSLLNALAEKSREEDFLFRPLYRLDRDTTGVFVLAKNRFSAGAVLTKWYLAVCEGEVEAAGEITSPIGLLEGHRVQRAAGAGQPAHTLFRRLSYDGAHSLVAFRLLTGRTHQIRVHMASIGHPVAGDDLYGGSTQIAPRQMLCCAKAEIECACLCKAFTVTADFSSREKRLFPNLFGKETPEFPVF